MAGLVLEVSIEKGDRGGGSSAYLKLRPQDILTAFALILLRHYLELES